MTQTITRIGLFLLAFWKFIPQSSSSQKTTVLPEDKFKVLDMPCHVAGIGAGGSGAFISEGLRTSWKYRICLKAFGVTEDDVLTQGDGLIVKKISTRLAASS